MAKYFRTSAVFNPISYQERIAPLAEYTKQYNAMQDKLGEVKVLGDTIGGLINPANENDIKLLNKYNEFNNQIGSLADSMANEGNLSDIRKSIIGLQGYYANQLAPIERGYNSWQEAIKAYDTAIAKDPTYIGIDPRIYGISNYMNGESPVDWSTSGSALATQGTKAAAALSSRINSIGNRGGYRVQITGLPESSANKVITAAKMIKSGSTEGELNSLGLTNTEKNAVNQLVRAYDQIYDEFQLNKLGDSANTNAASNAIWNGIYQGLASSYSEKAIPVTNVKINNGSKSGNGGDDISSVVNTHSKNFSIAQELTQKNKDLNKFFDNNGVLRSSKFDNQFDEDGKLRKKNRLVLNSPYASVTLKNPYNKEDPGLETDIYSLLKTVGYTDDNIDEMSKDDIRSILNDLYNKNKIDALNTNMAYVNVDTNDLGNYLAHSVGEVVSVNEDGITSTKKISKDLNKIIEDAIASEILASVNINGEPELYVDVISKDKTRTLYKLDINDFGGESLITDLYTANAIYNADKSNKDNRLLNNEKSYGSILKADTINKSRNDNTQTGLKQSK